MPTITPGNVYLMIDPNVYDSAPINPASMLNNKMAVIGSVFTPHSQTATRELINS